MSLCSQDRECQEMQLMWLFKQTRRNARLDQLNRCLKVILKQYVHINETTTGIFVGIQHLMYDFLWIVMVKVL